MISTSSEPTDTSVETVGGKAHSLFELKRLGCNIPDFFVVTVRGFEDRRDGAPSTELRREIVAAWRALGGDAHRYAVRSSATAEDSADESFAGIFETVLDVRSEEELIRAVESCWRSLDGARVDAYRAVKASAKQNSMAVIVQRMVAARWAGVCFTADPSTAALSVSVVNAVPGLAEDLVSGVADPEQVRVSNRDLTVLERRVPDGAAPMPDDVLLDVVRESGRVAARLDFPQDTEWAFDGSELFLLQSRPITTVTGVYFNRFLEPWRGSGDPDGENRVWTRGYADEVWTPPTSPLFYDLQYLGGHIESFLRVHGDRKPVPPDVFKYYRAAPYVDCALLERMQAFRPRSLRIAAVLNMLPRERHRAVLNARWRWAGFLRRTWDFEVKSGRSWGFTRNYKVLDESWPAFLDAVAPLVSADPKSMDGEELNAYVARIWSVAAIVGVECATAVLYYAYELKLLLTALLQHWCGDGEATYAAVSMGLEGSHTLREADEVWRISRLALAKGPAFVDRLERSSWREVAALGSEAQELVDAVDAFRRSHPHRGATYKDPIHPRWGDDVELVWGQIRSYLGPDISKPGEKNAHHARARRAAQAKVLDSLGGIGAVWRRYVLRRLFVFNEIYMGIRDDHRFYYDYIWWLLRRVYHEKGRRLVRRGVLSHEDDIFFLVRSEIAALEDGTLAAAAAAQRIRVRCDEWEQTRRALPPKLLRRGYSHDGGMSELVEGGRTMNGLGVSTGQVIGRARIIFDVRELGTLERGDILVTRQTDPSWTPAFNKLAGLVLETGGVLAHGASLCREFGLPCVTSIDGAPNRIPEGALIAIDGGLGTVRLLDERERAEVPTAATGARSGSAGS